MIGRILVTLLLSRVAGSTWFANMRAKHEIYGGLLLAVAEYTCPDYNEIRRPSVNQNAFNIHEIKGIWYFKTCVPMILVYPALLRDSLYPHSSNRYLIATTEPTTHFCLCNVLYLARHALLIHRLPISPSLVYKYCRHPTQVMNYTIDTKVYRYTDTCFEDVGKNSTWFNFTATIGSWSRPHGKERKSMLRLPLCRRIPTLAGGDLSSDPTSPGLLHEAFVIDNHTVTHKSPTMLWDIRRAADGSVSMMRIYACLGKIPPIIGKPTFRFGIASSLLFWSLLALSLARQLNLGVFSLRYLFCCPFFLQLFALLSISVLVSRAHWSGSCPWSRHERVRPGRNRLHQHLHVERMQRAIMRLHTTVLASKSRSEIHTLDVCDIVLI